MNISEALPLWGDHMNGQGRAALGVRTYLEKITLFQRWLAINEQSAHLEDITPLLIQAYLKTLRDQGRAPKSVELAYTIIGSFLGWAVDSDLLQKNSARRIRLRRSKERPPTVADYQTVLAQVESMRRTRFLGIDARDRVAYLLLLYTGMRISEACDLTWADVDWTQNVVTIHQTKGGEAFVRWVPLHDRLREELVRWRSVAELTWPGLAPVLISRRGKRTHRADIGQAFSRRGWYNPHALRHAFAVRCRAKGVDIRSIQQYLGHRSLDMTARYLTIVCPDVGAEAADLSAAF